MNMAEMQLTSCFSLKAKMETIEARQRSLMLLVYVVVPTDFLVRMRSRAFTRPSVT